MRTEYTLPRDADILGLELGTDAEGEPIKRFEKERCYGCGRDTVVAHLSADDPWQSVQLCSRCLRWLASVLDVPIKVEVK